MKILLVNKYHYVKGGSETYYFGLADLLTKLGHEVIYFSMADINNKPCEQEKYFVSNVDFNSSNSLGFIVIRRLVEQLNADIHLLDNVSGFGVKVVMSKDQILILFFYGLVYI